MGRVGGRQELNLQSPGCLTKKGTVEHEMMHALGFLHEQNRWERDKHVTVNYDNIQPGIVNDDNNKCYEPCFRNIYGMNKTISKCAILHSMLRVIIYNFKCKNSQVIGNDLKKERKK